MCQREKKVLERNKTRYVEYICYVIIALLDVIKVLYNPEFFILVAALSKTWVCDRSNAEITGSNAVRGMDVCLLWMLCVVM